MLAKQFERLIGALGIEYEQLIPRVVLNVTAKWPFERADFLKTSPRNFLKPGDNPVLCDSEGACAFIGQRGDSVLYQRFQKEI